MGMKPAKEDGGECWRQWYRTRKENLLRLSGRPPKALCIDQLRLTVCCRYTESVLKNVRISRYLTRHHPGKLADLQQLVDEFQNLRDQ